VNEELTQEPRRGMDMPKLTMGLFLVAIGLTFLFDRLYWWNTHEVFRLWPLWLIGFGVLRVAYPRQGRSRVAGFWPILIGSIFLLDTLDVMPIGDSWPLFIVGGGILMMLRATGVGRCEHGRRSGSERTEP
jgi:hypothetical protein